MKIGQKESATACCVVSGYDVSDMSDDHHRESRNKTRRNKTRLTSSVVRAPEAAERRINAAVEKS